MFHTCAITTGQKTSKVIAVGMACWPKIPTPASTLLPFATGSIFMFRAVLKPMMALKVPPLHADLHPSRRDGRFGHLEVLLLKVTHHVLSDGSEVLDNVGNGARRIESPHLKCLLTYEGRCPCLPLPASASQHPLLGPPLLRYHGGD